MSPEVHAENSVPATPTRRRFTSSCPALAPSPHAQGLFSTTYELFFSADSGSLSTTTVGTSSIRSSASPECRIRVKPPMSHTPIEWHRSRWRLYLQDEGCGAGSACACRARSGRCVPHALTCYVPCAPCVMHASVFTSNSGFGPASGWRSLGMSSTHGTPLGSAHWLLQTLSWAPR